MKEQMVFFTFIFSPGISTGHKNAENKEHHWFEKNILFLLVLMVNYFF